MTVAVVTGASRGLGAGMVGRFLERGVTVAGCARTEPALPGALTAAVDVTDAAAVDAFAARVAAELGPIHLWVNNAGVLDPMGPLRDLDPAGVEAHLRVNVMGVVHGTQAYARHVRDRDGGGVLVNISSGAALRGRAGWAAYCAGKAAVDRITESVQLEEAAAGLRAYAVAPGVVDTDMQVQIRATDPERFPDVGQFHELKERGAFNTPAYVADRLLDLAFDPAHRPAFDPAHRPAFDPAHRPAFEPSHRPDGVVLRLPPEHPY